MCPFVHVYGSFSRVFELLPFFVSEMQECRFAERRKGHEAI